MEKAEDIITFENVSEGVERNGIEPLTSTMPLLRSTNWANAPLKNSKSLIAGPILNQGFASLFFFIL